jgi:hypothetical protein
VPTIVKEGSMRTRTIAAACCAGAALAAAPGASAAPVVTQATGPNAAAIQAAVDQYRNDLGTNNAAGPPAPSGRRQIAWDGVPDLRSSPAFMPEGQFRGVGAVFTSPGTGFQVSGDDNSADAPPFDDPDQLNFSDINATYATTFAPFSAPRLFTPIGTNVYDTSFVVPGTATTATTNGFGAVFSDVDAVGPTAMEYFAPDGTSLGSFQVPATAGAATFSFLGVRFDAGERVARVRVTTGAAALAAGVNDVTAGGPSDLVVNDDFIFGEPQPLGPDTAGPSVTLARVPRSTRLRRLRRGLRVRVTPNEAASLDLALQASPRQLSIARFELVLVARSLPRAAGTRTVRLRPARRLLRNTARRFTVRLRVVATDAAGNRTTVNRRIRVRR